MRPNEISEKSSELQYLKKDAEADADTSAYDRVLNAMKNLDTSYKPTIQKTHEPFIEVNYKVMGDKRVIPIMEHKNDKIQCSCSTSISTEYGQPETLK